MTKTSPTANESRGFSLRKYLIPFILLIVLISGLILTNIFVQRPQKIDTKATADLVDLNLISSSGQIEADQEFTVTILMNTHDYTVSAAELHLEFSENLEAISFVPTDILPVILLPAELTNGTASLVIGSEPTNPKKGDGLRLANLTFRAKNSGTAIIEFDQTTQIAAIESHTDVAGDLTPLSFTVISPTPTPSPTPTSTPTPTPTLTPTPTPTPKIGDINDDDRVNIFDYNLLLERFDDKSTPTIFSDHFNGSSLDRVKWNSWTSPSSANISVRQENGVVRITIPTGQTQYSDGVIQMHRPIFGDWEITATLLVEAGESKNVADTVLRFGNDNDQAIIVLRRETDGRHLIANTLAGGQWGTGYSTVISGDGPVPVKLKRTDDTISFYYKNSGGEYQQLGSQSGFYSGPGVVTLFVNTKESPFPAITSSFDDLLVNANNIDAPPNQFADLDDDGDVDIFDYNLLLENFEG